MTWEYRQALLHCVRRPDGTVFGLLAARPEREDQRQAAHALLEEFRQLRLGVSGVTEFIGRR
jgi:hypothetical protein